MRAETVMADKEMPDAMPQDETTTERIAVKPRTKRRLEKVKIIREETMDSVINRIMDRAEGKA